MYQSWGYFRLCLLHLWCVYTHMWWSLFPLPEQLAVGPPSTLDTGQDLWWEKGNGLASHSSFSAALVFAVRELLSLVGIPRCSFPKVCLLSGCFRKSTHAWIRHQQDLKLKGSSQVSGCLGPTSHTPYWLSASVSQRLLFPALGPPLGPIPASLPRNHTGHLCNTDLFKWANAAWGWGVSLGLRQV